ncbi:transporter [Peptostreptococcus sp. MV1]|uniref:cation:proton antiporter n=1 Tax=Peptostreptococcus sp. MV1 TaxID=1219626 RepID=UPI00050E3BA7|nr:cation:proton antiporter [Peptostreptococcus sp. MV1]KGF15190.1 transporter [Peptostreptococcus sp. MV1]
MLDYTYMLSIAIILFSTKVFGFLTEKIKLPQVVGALLAGVIIGPSMLGIVKDTAFLDQVSQIGVIILMFMAGLDTDLAEIKKNSVSYLTIAIFGVIIPLIGGILAYILFLNFKMGAHADILKAVFVGVVLTATSVSITVEALRELGYANSRVGNAILGAAIVDDIIGIIILTFVTSFRDANISMSYVLLKIALYFVAMFVLAVITTFLARFLDFKTDQRRISVYVFALVMLVAYFSEKYVGIADITGAYLVGMIFSRFSVRNEIVKKMNVMSYLFFAPLFFASIGLKTNLGKFNKDVLLFSIILLIIAILTKIIGAGLGALICKYDKYEALNIGIGMVSRGEVALIVAGKGNKLGLIEHTMFSPVILMVVVTTIITPVLLKHTLKYLGKGQTGTNEALASE